MPRAVSAAFYEEVCPWSKQTFIILVDAEDLTEGHDVFNWWVAKLKAMSVLCVEVGNNPPVFSWFLFSSDRVLSLWPSLSAPPIVKDFTWSSLVTSGVARNLNLLTHRPAAVVPDTIHGLVAVHLQRGDYMCSLPTPRRMGATYMGFNQFPSPPDRFRPPKLGSLDAIDGWMKYYMAHCWPEVDEIVQRLSEVRKERPDLQWVYVLTNGWGWRVDGLRQALKEVGWADLKSSLDIQVDSEQKYRAMTIDMAIVEQTEVFIGQ